MDMNSLDERFRQVALDGLKSFKHTEFTVRFLKEQDLPIKPGLKQMWAEIQTWLSPGDSSRCRALLEYVADLMMWGRQRVFLYEIKGKREELTKQLSSPAKVRELVGAAYDNPIYRWEAKELFLGEAEHTKDPDTDAPLLVLKFIQTREFDVEVDRILTSHEERSINFFIVNLREGFAQLRVQQLPTRAHRNLNRERQLLEAEIGKHLKLERFSDRFSPIKLKPIMAKIHRTPIYTVTAADFVAGKGNGKKAPFLSAILAILFKNPVIAKIAVYWQCYQDVLGERRLHFTLHGANNHIAFAGIADPRRISDILKNIVNISRGILPTDITEDGSVWLKGSVDEKYKNLEGQPKAQAFVLSAGIIAASVIWIVIEGIGNYLLRDWVEKILHGVPLIAITIFINLVFIWRYYGWRRIKRSFKALWNMPLSKIWEIIKEARKDDKIKQGVDNEDQDQESDGTDLAEPEDDD